MCRALDTIGTDLNAYRPVLCRLLDHALDHGIDWEHGGIYRDGLRTTGETIVFEKEFWQHAEALVGFCDGYERWSDERYQEALECVWKGIQKYMIIPEVGEWRTLLTREGKILDGKIGNPWKVAYHNGRAMLECVRRLAGMTG